MRIFGTRVRWIVPAIMAVVFAFSLTYWIGCSSEKTNIATEPIKRAFEFTKQSAQVEAAMAVQNRHTGELMAIPGVVGTGVGLGLNNAPVVLVLVQQDGIQGLPATIEGIPTRVDVVGEIRAMAYTKAYRPVPCGVSVGNDKECAAGTIGCVVLKGGVQYSLSNNHVFARENAASIGERIDQPGRYDGKPKCAQTGQIATLSAFSPITFSTSANNVIDAAIAQYTTAALCSMVGGSYTPTSTVVAPSVGLAVKKTGRTSGLTHGVIAGINVTVNVSYSSGVARFVNQIYVASNFIRSGDSGSLMVTETGNNPVGLCFAGGSASAFANPMGPVLSYFSATVCSQ